MVDTRGAFDLPAVAPILRFDEPAGIDRATLELYSRRSLDMLADGAWIRDQTLRLAVAMVLHSRLLHLPDERLRRYGQSKDPGAVTLAQLAGLHRPHLGVAGQAFEIAVAEACNQGVPEVVGPISWALQQFGVRDPEHPRMVVLGLEKLPEGSDALAVLRETLPSEARMRNGLPGRPLNANTVLERIASSTWATMNPARLVDPDDRFETVLEGDRLRSSYEASTVSQLGRCDALVYTESAIVPASLKINARHVTSHGWLDVPLWITSSYGTSSPRATADAQRTARLPTYVACIDNGGGFGQALLTALATVDLALSRMDPASKVPPRYRQGMGLADHGLQRALWRRRNETVQEVCEALRGSAHQVSQDLLAPRMSFELGAGAIPVLDNASIVDAWQDRLADRQIDLGHRHLWAPEYPGGRAARLQQSVDGRSRFLR